MNETEQNLGRAAGTRAIRALIADDDPAIRLVLRHRLEAEGWRVEEAADSGAALDALGSGRFDVALVDIIMPGVGGLEVLTTAREQGCATPIVVITAASTMNNAIEALKRGARDYLTKPFENLDLVVTTAARAAETAAQASELERVKKELDRKLVGGEIIGHSAAIQEVYKLIGRVVSNDKIDVVLVSGESGTGKELVARAIHFKARRREPFIPVNCSAIPHGLVESELFGHERGAFTGAAERRTGKFEAAGEGTLFLDEIGDLPLELQPKLLRVLQEREFTRVGGLETQRLQARIIAATNQDLETAVAARQFREDLYFPPADHPDPPAAAASAPRGHPRADRFLRRQGGQRNGLARNRGQPRGARETARLRLARQRARAGEHDAAGGAARLGQHHPRRRHLARPQPLGRRRLRCRKATPPTPSPRSSDAASRSISRKPTARSRAGFTRSWSPRSNARSSSRRCAGRRATRCAPRASSGLNRNTLRKKLVDLGIATRKLPVRLAARAARLVLDVMKLPSHFYAMVDPAGGHEPVALARILLDAGARVMQLRLKHASGRDLLAAARTIAAMCRERGAMLIVDDRADVAMLAGAAGVHLGQDDLPLEAARRLLGRDTDHRNLHP